VTSQDADKLGTALLARMTRNRTADLLEGVKLEILLPAMTGNLVGAIMVAGNCTERQAVAKLMEFLKSMYMQAEIEEAELAQLFE